jgi:general secretion pathway protein C
VAGGGTVLAVWGGFVELLFRKYFWAVNLAFVFLAALLAARTANLFVEYTLAPASASALPKSQAKAHLAVAAVTRLDMERIAKLAGLPLPAPEPDVKEPKMTVDLSSEPVKSGMKVKVLGVLLSGVPEWSFASIQEVNSGTVTTYMAGDSIQRARILAILRVPVPHATGVPLPTSPTPNAKADGTFVASEARVVIVNNGRREYLNGEPGSGEAPVPVPVAMTVRHDDSPPPSVALGNGIKALNDNEYTVPRGEIDKTLSNLNDVAMQARIVPAFKDGQSEGFKLFSIRPDSIYTKIGVQNGDVIKRINGYDLNSPEKALEIYSKLKEAARIDIEIDRNGTTMRKTYTIQ